MLVAGGSGAVPHGAIQVARAGGARRVIATVGSPQKAEVAEAAGADLTIDYRAEDVAARIAELTGEDGVDRIVESALASNIGLDLQAVRRGGLIVAYGSDGPEVSIPFFPAILGNVGLQFFIVYHLAEPDRQAAIAGVTGLLEQHLLQPRVGATFPLERIAEAHERVEQGDTGGNVLLAFE
ncbi:MAG: zinc-binding dehydrogenase [Halofilum sp. (in: g-proteobacteria)]|nr:zinc-binding dehydrogenase [Halofilum sp. (in: g-proteobacteria)]